MNKKEIIKKHFQTLGRKGGKLVKEKFGLNHYSEMGRRSARSKRLKK